MVEDLEPMSEERLMELRKMRDDIKRQPYSDWGFSYQQDIADAVDEIDRLRAEMGCHQTRGDLMTENQSMSDERLALWHQMRARLRKRVGKSDLRSVDYEFMGAVDEIDRLRADNDRLREALERLAAISDDSYGVAAIGGACRPRGREATFMVATRRQQAPPPLPTGKKKESAWWKI